jgi:hypothetical protein
MSDFSPEVPAMQHYGPVTLRRFVEGRGGEVYAEKIGAKPLDDLSDKESQCRWAWSCRNPSCASLPDAIR